MKMYEDPPSEISQGPPCAQAQAGDHHRPAVPVRRLHGARQRQRAEVQVRPLRVRPPHELRPPRILHQTSSFRRPRVPVPAPLPALRGPDVLQRLRPRNARVRLPLVGEGQGHQPPSVLRGAEDGHRSPGRAHAAALQGGQARLPRLRREGPPARLPLITRSSGGSERRRCGRTGGSTAETTGTCTSRA
jgi:hypothetical protein